MIGVDALAPLPVVVPLIGAAVLVALHAVARRRLADLLATAVAIAVTVICLVLLARSLDETVVHWFGNWPPRGDVVLGVGFVIDPIGAGMAAVCAALVSAAFVFTWRYFDAVGVLFHSLVLVFLAAICGFCLSGDLFNMFVFFELMSVAAYGLTGYKAEEPGPLQGALNFAVTNSIGALMILSGIALLYARTGALNLAAIGRGIAGESPDGLVVVAFVFVVFGFLVKGAVVPFHFWLADAHAVAPTPVCVLFSGVMVELGLYAAARSYWTVFAPAFEVHESGVRALLVGVGVVTALVGAVMSLVQRHLKRMLAFSTVTYAGLFLLGFAMLDARGLAGSALFVLSHAFLKGGLFMCAGVLLHRWGTVDIGALNGRGRTERLAGVLFVVGGAGLVGIPPFGTFLGKGLIEESAAEVGYGWVVVVFVVASGLECGGRPARRRRGSSSGGIRRRRAPRTRRALRDRGRARPDPTRDARSDRSPGLRRDGRRVDPRTGGRRGARCGAFRRLLRVRRSGDRRNRCWRGPGTGASRSRLHRRGRGECGDGRRLGRRGAADHGAAPVAAERRARLRLRERVVSPLRALHSGHIGDYIAWLTAGVAAFGGILAAVTR